ncbi:MAG: TetR family transcriptional regulator [Polyangiaceae bacterium]|nr:TetR family transcriptional regulator [Polyangiaceae bacterium]
MIRARKAEDKEGRKRTILGAARSIWENVPSFDAFNMADVAERAGFAKGTVYIYFATKEALLLELLREALIEWLDVINARLEQGGVWSPKRVAHLLSETLDVRPPLIHLLALMSSILEANVPEEQTLQFKLFLRDRVAVTGVHIEKRLPFLLPGEGARVLVLCHALVTGLWPMASPPPVVKKVLERPDLAVFCVDFAKDLESALYTLLLGMSSTRSA